jgi:succinate dehydrogenase / fumarate reductase flavoprotein subunit
MSVKLDSKVPAGALSDKWTQYRSTMNLVAPNNKRRIDIIVVGTGLPEHQQPYPR